MTENSKKVQNKKKVSHGFQTHLRRLLEDVNSEAHVSGDVLCQLQSFMNIIVRNIASKSLESCQNSKKKTIADNDVMLAAVQVLGEGPILKKARKHLKKALKHQESFENKTKAESEDGSSKRKVVRREEKAGIIISISQCAKYLKNFGSCKNNVTQVSHLALAVILQELMRLVFTEALSVSQKEKKVTLKIKHITIGINENEYLCNIVKKNNIFFIKGIVQSDFFISHKSKKGSKVSIDIKKYKKSEDLLLQKKPFLDDVKIVAVQHGQLKFGFGSVLVLQYLIEHLLVDTLSVANKLSSHDNRKTVGEKDMKFAMEITKRIRNFQNKEIEDDDFSSSISDAGIKRCARKAGICIIAKSILITCKKFIRLILLNFIPSCVLILRTKKVVNLTIKTVQEALTEYNIYCTTPVFQKKKKTAKKEEESEESSDHTKGGEIDDFEVTTSEKSD
ncbi:MAG TPA: histone-like protein [Nitrosarchaeum sp.]|nr:histone-like protein [Nitrosarchaeum sp.]